MIPLVDLKSQICKLKPLLDQATEEVFSTGSFINGKKVKEFENSFAALHQFENAIGCSNGTSAITLALEALGIGPGDEVMTVANTFIGTVEGISELGAKPVLVDVDPETLLLDISEVERKLTPRTRVLIVVHLFGTPCEMDLIVDFCSKHNILLIEDCAQAHLAQYDGKPVGNFGHAATFSFYPGKNLGAFGDAGLVACRSPSVSLTVRQLRDHGRYGKKYEHDLKGHNFRMDEIQAAWLLVKLKFLASWTEKRRQNAQLYADRLESLGLIPLSIPKKSWAVFHLFVVRVENRQEVADYLREKGVQTGIHYPVPLHLQPAYKSLGYKMGDFPVAEQAASEILSLPMCAELESEPIDLICDLMAKVARPVNRCNDKRNYSDPPYQMPSEPHV